MSHTRPRSKPHTRTAAHPRVPLALPRIDGDPRRSVTSVNVRHDEKRVFDLLHSWWSLRSGSALAQHDAFSVLLALALANPDADLPEELARAGP